MKKMILTIVLVTLAAGTGLAIDPPTPVGTAFTYQGRLIADDVPGEGTYDMQFQLHWLPDGKSYLGPAITFEEVEVIDGYFTADLDFGDVFNGENRYLSIAVRPTGDPCDYTLLSPRQRLAPTPYALHALSAPTYTGRSPVNVNNANMTIGLNPATLGGDLLAWDGNNWVARRAYTHREESNLQPFQCVSFIIALTGVYPSRSSAEPFIAEISMFGGNFAPRGWAFCNGQLLPIQDNTALFSLIGTLYGGDGRTNFALPDLRGRVPMHWGTGPGLSPRNIGNKGGVETITPAHNN